MFIRSHYQLLKSRILEPKRFIQAILGPRQIGKTTLVHQLLEDIDIPYHIVSADGVASDQTIWIAQQWENARIKLATGAHRELLLVIDEIQKIDNWSEAVKAQWDQDTFRQCFIKVILLGSSSLILQSGLTESLAGRFEVIPMSHWTFDEMHEAFGFSAEQYAWFGGYPGSVSLIEEELRWKNYVRDALIETIISKDILMLTRIDKPALLKRLFEFGCLFSGQILSYTKVLGQLQDAGNTVTLSHYLKLLDTAGLLSGIEKFSGSKVRQRASSPKFQVYNQALVSALYSETYQEIRQDPVRWGRIVESAVGAHLLNHARNGEFKIYYWRHRNDEIDYVLEKGGKHIALEVKSGVNMKASGVKAFQKLYKPDKVLLIGDAGLPWQDFLSINPGDLF